MSNHKIDWLHQNQTHSIPSKAMHKWCGDLRPAATSTSTVAQAAAHMHGGRSSVWTWVPLEQEKEALITTLFKKSFCVAEIGRSGF
jgi:hypothetical protein